MVKISRPYASGIVAKATALPRSATIRIGRRKRRSTYTPAGRLKSMNGSSSTAVSAATSNALASRIEMATNGSASALTWLPKALMVSADQSLRKSPWRQRPLRGERANANRRAITVAGYPWSWRSLERSKRRNLHTRHGVDSAWVGH
jgi:hypothetical protein